MHLNCSTQTERTKCCIKGEANNLPHKLIFKEIQEPLLSIYKNTNSLSIACNTINNILSFGATGVENSAGGAFEHDMLGPHAVKLNGRTYHLLHNANNNSTDPSCGLSYFVFDNITALNSASQSRQVDNTVVQAIFRYLTVYNPIARNLKAIGTEILHQDDRFLDRETPILIARMNQQAQYLEVASITNSNATGNKIIRFQMKNKPNTTQINMTSEILEPLCYPLLFTRGEDGWGDIYRKQIKFPAYLASRMLKPDNIIMPTLHDNSRTINVNRMQLLARLGQTYLVDMVSRAIDYKLKWNYNNQDNIFCGQHEMRYNRDEHVAEAVDDDERSTFLPSSFHGSPRHLKELSNNALSIVSELGPADLFITLTCNPNWNEIQEMLLPGQTAFDRPDIVCQVLDNKYYNCIYITIYDLHRYIT